MFYHSCSYLQLPEAKKMGFRDADFLMGFGEYFDYDYEMWGLDFLSAKYYCKLSLSNECIVLGRMCNFKCPSSHILKVKRNKWN